jgi:ketosteroid isomerase-like protein
MSQANLQAAQRLYDAFNNGDLEAFEQGVSRDLVWNEAENSLNAGGNPYRSFSAVRDGVFVPTKRDFEQFVVDLEQLHDAGDTIIGTGRYRGRSVETGRQISAQFCHVCHFDSDSKLDRLQEYADTLQEAEVTGRTPQVEEIKVFQPAT